MRNGFRKTLIQEILRLEGRGNMVATKRLCKALGGDRKAVHRNMAFLVRKGVATPVYRYAGPGILNNRGGPAFLTETIYVISYPKLEELLKPKGKRPTQSGWQRMWRVIRAARRFTRADLCQLAGVTRENAITFTKELRKAGCIRQRTKGIWELIKDPGPRRPPLNPGIKRNRK